MKPVYLYDAIRTPRARAKDHGGLYDLRPHDLLQQLYLSLAQRTGLDPALVGDVLLGCVTQHGDQGGNIAKTSTLYAGWPSTIGGLTVNRFCSSSIDAISLAALKIAAGQEQAVIAGGVEMMSRVPMLSDQATVFMDPQFAAQCHMLMMGSGADLIASLHGVSREQADAIALQSQQRADHARREGFFKSIIPIDNPVKGITVTEDECIRPQTTLESLAEMPPAFAELGSKGVDAMQLAGHPQLAAVDHVHTAGNSPAMADAAAITLLGDAALADKLQVKSRARILAAATASDDPLQVLSGCVAATEKLMAQQNLHVADVDLFELHEAFAATVVKCQQQLGIPNDKLNVNGGVIALGHPMGATGAIMTGVLLDEMERREVRLGIVAASGAAGAGSALLIEREAAA
jgi:acetyl-CoA C-acetyltransferase